MYSDMSMRTMALSSSEQELGQGPRQFGLADAGGPEKTGTSRSGRFRILQTGPRPADRV